MSEREILALLREAYDLFYRGDIGAYAVRLRTAQMAIPQDADRLMGEWVLMSALTHLREPARALPLFRQARKLLAGRPARVFPRGGSMLMDWSNALAAFNMIPGQTDETATQVEEMEEHFVAMTGGGQGTAEAYRAQLAYYRGDMIGARRLGESAFRKAKEAHQLSNALCAADLLAGLAKHTLDAPLWERANSYLRRLAAGAEPGSSRATKELAQLHLCVLDMSVGLLNQVPEWVRGSEFQVVSAPWGYRMLGDEVCYGNLSYAMMARLEYFSYSGKPGQALVVAELMERAYGMGDVLTSPYVAMLRAGCHAQLEEPDQVGLCLERAVELLAPDGLWLIAAEFLPPFAEPLYSTVERQAGKEAVERIRAIGEGFWDKLRPLRATLRNDGLEEKLTRREHDVISHVLRGLTYAEIAQELGIGTGTVKTHLLRAYSKLRVERRSQLAAAMKLKNPGELLAIWAQEN